MAPTLHFLLSFAEQGPIEFLLERDQLNNERAANRVFHGFDEAPITFLPTYKYV